MDNIQKHAFGDDGRAGGGKMQFRVLAVRTHKGGGNSALIRQSTPLAERRLDKIDVLPTNAADKTNVPCATSGSASLAAFAGNERKSAHYPTLQNFSKNIHVCVHTRD